MASSPLPSTEIHILSITECFVYKVPPLRSASGHRAEEWSLDAPLFTGAMKLYRIDDKLRILLYTYKQADHQILDDDHTNFFGECPCEVKPGENITTFVDAVIDSSRYYVLRIKDPNSTRTTLIGIGFRERDTAFDFKNALNEYVKYVDRMHLAEKLTIADGFNTDSNAEGDFQLPPMQHLDEHIAPLKDGEKIKVKVTSRKSGSSTDGTTTSTATSGASIKGFTLKPPPPAPTAASNNGGEDEEWGDFA